MAHMHAFTRRLQVIIISGIVCLTSGGTLASGFALIEQSVSSMGTAYAGAGSAAEDASYIFFNPASMSRLEDAQLTAGLHVVLPNTKFTGTGTFTNTGGAPPGGLDGVAYEVAGGGNGGDAGTLGVLPHFAYTREINDRMNAGITFNVPFGLKTEYDYGWAGRYAATESEIVSLNINPTLSYEINDTTTVGIGVSALYANLIFRPTIDYGLLVLGSPGTLATDGQAKVDIDDWGFGFNLGILFEPTESTRLGLAYRSKVEVDLDGTSKVSAVGPVPESKLGANANADLPATATISITHDINDTWTIMGDLLWTEWSNLQTLAIDRSDGSAITVPLEWDDAIRAAVGASYKYNEQWTLRGGLAFDETPTKSPELRIASLPDEDRLWLTLGAGLQYSKNLSFDFGYAHLFIDDTDINSEDAIISPAPGVANHNLNGEYEASVDIVSAQLNWAFN